MARVWPIALVWLAAMAHPAFAGPPYVSDDPEPTDYKHFEIYTFNSGTTTQSGTSGAAGIDFNYGAAPDLQLTLAIPSEVLPTSASAISSLPQSTASCIRTTSGWMSVFFRAFFCRAVQTRLGTAAPPCCFQFGCRRTGVAAGRLLAAADVRSMSKARRIRA
jgi:hypothetical protein